MNLNKNLPRYSATIGILVLLTVIIFSFLKNISTDSGVSSLVKRTTSELREKENQYSTTTLKISSQNSEKIIQVDLAQTPAERTQGLSGRKSLAPDHGLLFIFEKTDIYGFWMPDMHFSIDILWVNEEKKIVHIEKNVSPDSYPKIFKPTTAAKYVLEVPAGFSNKNSIEVGDMTSF